MSPEGALATRTLLVVTCLAADGWREATVRVIFAREKGVMVLRNPVPTFTTTPSSARSKDRVSGRVVVAPQLLLQPQ